MPTPLHLKPPIAAWIVRSRKARGWKPRDIVTALAAQGITVTEDTVKVWESNANRRPAPETLDALERIFGSPAPTRDAPASPDQAELVAAIRDQTAAITKLAAAMEAENRERRRETATTRAWLRGWRAVLRAAAQGQVPGDLLDALVPPQPGDGHP